jgi:hypothetical protein
VKRDVVTVVAVVAVVAFVSILFGAGKLFSSHLVLLIFCLSVCKRRFSDQERDC